LTRNYIGRSNWERATAEYQDADERLRGALFDFRLYRTPMSADKIRRTVEWGREKLGLLGDAAA
jgi:protein involved in temperature-dependent protein secretion